MVRGLEIARAAAAAAADIHTIAEQGKEGEL